MGWLGRLLGVTPKEDLEGIHLDTRQAFWELDGRTDFPHLLRALDDLLPEESILYFEDGSPGKALLAFLKAHKAPQQTHVAVGTLWPKPACYHVPATRQNLSELAHLAESIAAPELAVHFHVYHSAEVLLEWHDAFAQPMLLSGILPESKVTACAESLGMTIRRREPQSSETTHDTSKDRGQHP